jgi:hypothetical protein
MGEVFVLENHSYGYPQALEMLFDENPDTKIYFLSLPSEIQQALLNEEIHSGESMYNCIARLKVKE